MEKKKYYAEPVCTKEGNQAFGGNFIYSRSANYNEMVEGSFPLPVHDSFENWG